MELNLTLPVGIESAVGLISPERSSLWDTGLAASTERGQEHGLVTVKVPRAYAVVFAHSGKLRRRGGVQAEAPELAVVVALAKCRSLQEVRMSR